MKKLFTILFLTLLVSALYAQPPINCMFLVDEEIPTEGDKANNQFVLDQLEGFGFDVTVVVISALSPTTGYDLCVVSESIASGNGNWPRYSTAPMPMMNSKVFSIKETALGWVDNELRGTSYDNAADTIITIKNDNHEIFTGFSGDKIQVGDNVGTQVDNVCWVNIPATTGLEVLGIAGDNENFHALVAMEAGTSLNATTPVVLANKAVILGMHLVFYDEVNANGWKLFRNACYWAAGRDVPNDPSAVADNFEVKTSVYPNPSTGEVNMKLSQRVNDLTVNIFSIDGKVVFSENLSNTDNATFDLSMLNSGIYYIKTTGDLSSTDKLIIQ